MEFNNTAVMDDLIESRDRNKAAMGLLTLV